MCVPDTVVRASLVVLFLCGCANQDGTDFARLDATALIAAHANEQQVIAQEGVPSEWHTVANPEPPHARELTSFDPSPDVRLWSSLRYQYMSTPIGGQAGLRLEILNFSDHRLCQWLYSSNIAPLDTRFDIAAAETITRGMDRSTVVARLGPPNGGAIYPCIGAPGSTEATYIYQTWAARRNVTRHLFVLFDDAGRVTETQLDSKDQPL